VPETDAEAYRRSAELLFSSDPDDERSMAAMRGALAAGKRVPSKEALASLEIVKLEDLEENGRSRFHVPNIFQDQDRCLPVSRVGKLLVFNAFLTLSALKSSGCDCLHGKLGLFEVPLTNCQHASSATMNSASATQKA
jgi:hypothetical protein